MTSSEDPQRSNQVVFQDVGVEHDLVLNPYIAIEKKKRASSELFKKGIMPGSLVLPRSVVAITILFMFGLLVTIIFANFGGSAFEGWTALAAHMLGLIVIVMYVSIHHRGVPTNLLLDRNGLRFRWCKKSTYSSPLFRWDQIVSATIFQEQFYKENQRSEARFLRIRIKTESLSRHQHWWLWTSGAQLRPDAGMPFEHEKCYLDRVVFDIPLDAFTRDSDERLLLDIVTQRLGKEKVGDALQLEVANAPTFTQLWLDEAQSFRRQSIESLESKKVLQNGRYSVVERIASGGQATVYRALDNSIGPPGLVVLKELILPVSAGSEVRKRSFESVKNEALLLGSLSHSGIIKLIDNFIEDHRAYLVLEHVDGTTLRDLVDSDGPLSEVEVLSILAQLCDIFGYLHGQAPPVVHRDFSPDNLMMMSDGKVKLLDFNVALQSESTATKTVVGKHHYIAPEQFRGKPCPQSDLYSIGASIYFFRTGKDPVSLKTASLTEHGLEANALDSIVKTLTAMDLSNRFRSVDELKAAISLNNPVEFT